MHGGGDKEDRSDGAARRPPRAIAIAPEIRRPFALPTAALAAAIAARLKADLVEESASGRLVLWLPVAFTAGILAYFAAHNEPSLLAALLLSGALTAALVALRRQGVAFAAAAGLLAFALGFTAGCVRTAWVWHEPVTPPIAAVRLSGHVESLERRASTDRILLRLDPTPIAGLAGQPNLIRLSLRHGTSPAVGTHITQLARLLPPQGPALPGGHDFGRGPWFDGIDATGFGLGRPTLTHSPAPAPISVRFAVAVAHVRSALTERIRSVLPGLSGDIAVALVAGDRSSIPRAVEDGMRVSGLTHVLSISGLHMALVAGTLFALVRGALALLPQLALGWPVKAMAAIVALAGSAGYLILSGNDVPAQRSFVMTALVLGGVLVGRRALTLRTVAVAAVVVLGLTPEAVLEPGTQMSFAATLALIAAYERLRPLSALPRPDRHVAQILLVPLLFLAGTALTSTVAGLASGPYGAFHFQRIAPYGLLANLAAMPAVSLLVMPFGLVGVLLLPFGWDFVAWPVMGLGIDIMLAVSDRVAALPGADVRTAAVNGASIGWFSLALICLCLLRGSLSVVALPLLGLALWSGGPQPRPDILIAPNGTTVAVRGADGRLSVIGAKSQRFLVEQWLTREADLRAADRSDLAQGFRCDPLGCVAALPSGGTLAVSYRAESLAADCLNARIVVTRDIPPLRCPAKTVTTAELAQSGTLALFLTKDTIEQQPSRDPALNRPWMARAKRAAVAPPNVTTHDDETTEVPAQ